MTLFAFVCGGLVGAAMTMLVLAWYDDYGKNYPRRDM